jgi:hypothetical protein
MSNYIDFIDQNSINAGNKLFALGHYSLALVNYQKAFNLLYKYNGDQSYPIALAGELRNKISICRIKTYSK